MTTCSHPMPVEAPLRPSPLSSPSNEQAHHMRLLRPCRYDCEQNDLVDEENCGSRIEAYGLRIADCGLRIADCGLRILATEPQSHRADQHRMAFIFLCSSLCLCVSVANIRNSLRFAYPYVRAVVGIQAESIRRRADTYVGMRESPGASSTKKKTVRISRLPQG